MSDWDSPKAHEILSRLLEKHSGQILASNRHWRVEVALKPVMRMYSIPDIATLAAVIASGADEALSLSCVEAMINNETCFFRDQANFALLTGPIFDSIRSARFNKRRLRIWSAACSTGQEPYSLAMMMIENSEKWRGWNIEIMATDVSSAALQRAKEGVYSQFEIQRGLPVVMMLKYFEQVGEDWVAKKALRQMINFKQHNMLDSCHHFGTFDVILCRNMLMYLSEEKRGHVLESISASLAPDGMVMLGAAETVIGQTDSLTSSREFRGFYHPKQLSENASFERVA
jgi:chemotaxis protein methyltransferase CheR